MADTYRKNKTCLICEQEYTAKAANQKWCDACVPDAQARHRFRRYGISAPQYRMMLENQLGHCALCSEREKLVIDHCHKTGANRGLLCYGCNIALGRVDVDGWADRAKEYSRSCS